MNGKRWYLAFIFTMGLVAALPSGASGQPTEAEPAANQPLSTADHSDFEVLEQRFASGRELTKACLGCHNLAARQVHGSTHWKWEYPNQKTGQLLGKKNILNSTLISISSNGPYCARCHIGNEWKEEEQPPRLAP